MKEINKSEFLAWYFSGSDQEQCDLAFDLGQEARENLEENGTYTINVDDLIRECGDVFIDNALNDRYERE